jgi:very-short-patch-repair endonuclease
MAAVLALGPNAVLSHLSAAALWEIWRRRVKQIEVLAPKGRTAGHRGIRLRAYRTLDERDVTRKDGIPVTTVARTLVDLSDVLTAHQLANVLHEAAFRGLLNVAATRSAIARSKGRHNLQTLESALLAHLSGSAGTKSGNEDRFLALVRSHGLPEPLVNTPVQAGSRSYEVDFHWPEHRLCVEIDGSGHDRPRTKREDREHDQALRSAGQEVLRFTDRDLLMRPEWVLRTVQAAIER